MREHRLRTILVHELTIVLVLAAVVRAVLIATAVAVGGDGPEYCWTALRMVDRGLLAGMKGEFLYPFFSVNRRLPMYPFLGALVYRLVGDMVLAMRLVSAIAGLGAVALAYGVARELFRERTVAGFAAGLVALHPVLARGSAEVLREVLTGFFLLLALYLLLLSLRGRRLWPVLAVLVGAVGFFAFMTRVEAAVLMPLFCVVPFAQAGLTLRRRLAIASCVFIGFWVLEAPYVLWLRQQTGRLLPSQALIQKIEDSDHTMDRKLFGESDEGIR